MEKTLVWVGRMFTGGALAEGGGGKLVVRLLGVFHILTLQEAAASMRQRSGN